MPFLSGIGDETVVADIFEWSPEACRCISEWHQIVMRGESPLSVAERELIVAYTSGVNSCELCYGVHHLVAERFGIEKGTFEALFDDIESAPVDEKMKPLLRYARKLTLEPAKMVQTDAQAVFDAGWSEQALHDVETFGPVVCCIKARNSDEAMELANNSSYGLSSAVITNDLGKAMQFAEGLDAGMVHINGTTSQCEPNVPFGGVKNSGFGREGGHYLVDDMTQPKWITINQGQMQYPF